MQQTSPIKAIFFDIDGTLVSFNTHRVSDPVRRALQQLQARGIKLFISSGRHVRSINNLPGLEFDGYVVINGTLAFSGSDVIYRHPIPQADVLNWIEYLKHDQRSTVFVYEDNLTVNFVDDTMQQIFDLLDFPMPLVGPLEPLADRPIYQIISTFNPDEEEAIMTHLPHCKTTRWHPLFTDIIEQGASKALGIQSVLDHFGWTPDQVMAFGDGGNDVEMLQLVGTGIAMGNASDAVKQLADYVTDSVDEDGIVTALRHFGLID